MKGQNVCKNHGGAAPAARQKAAERILMAQDLAAAKLIELMNDPTVPPNVQRSAAADLLDRGGNVAAHVLAIPGIGNDAPWLRIVESVIAGGSRAESRAARGFAGDDPLVLEAEVVDGDGVGAAGMLDGVGSGTAAPVPNSAAPQPHSPVAAGNAGSTTGAGGGTGTPAPRQRRTDDLSGTPIVSLADAHPGSDEPRRNPHKKNRAISPKLKRERF
ncbi:MULTISPECIES: hypothetical protein [unclassified Rhodococcus (in: high G+C Gram-positive bacteria)]|uniref:hypothetical protein n=1 Tax=unclassified Rhodococcus (in: high G+C Gram-positive bacteria) TaxID=192944 RepID=UPI0015C5D5C5|nr:MULTISPECIES: hypothetical protein [unclassified Rhodococcus (in: high G+C Gram-positive bacteria)]